MFPFYVVEPAQTEWAWPALFTPKSTEPLNFEGIFANLKSLQYEIHTIRRVWMNVLSAWETHNFSQHWTLKAAIAKYKKIGLFKKNRFYLAPRLIPVHLNVI